MMNTSFVQRGRYARSGENRISAVILLAVRMVPHVSNVKVSLCAVDAHRAAGEATFKSRAVRF